MRRIIMLMIAVLPAISFAQAPKAPSSAHLAFKGVAIDGSLNEFVSAMEKNGFVKVESEEGYALLKGDFGSFKNSYVAVETLKDVVSKVAVMLPITDSWTTLSTDYFSAKEMLTKEYGKPSSFVEQFRGGIPADDIAKMEKVKTDKCEYYTTYETSKGSVQLSIEHDRSQKCFVQVAYYDKINGEGL